MNARLEEDVRRERNRSRRRGVTLPFLHGSDSFVLESSLSSTDHHRVPTSTPLDGNRTDSRRIVPPCFSVPKSSSSPQVPTNLHPTPPFFSPPPPLLSSPNPLKHTTDVHQERGLQVRGCSPRGSCLLSWICSRNGRRAKARPSHRHEVGPLSNSSRCSFVLDEADLPFSSLSLTF